MLLRILTPAPCYPVTLAEARKHLAVDASDRSNDVLIDLLIASATNDAELKTGRVWCESQWEWKPDTFTLNEELEFPIVPVRDIKIYDLDEEILEDGEPTDLAPELVSVLYPSPEPQGFPLIGSITPLVAFPENYKIVLTAGYPVQVTETLVEQADSPELVAEKTGYSLTKIHLVFNRPVTGTADASHFSVTQNDVPIDVSSVEYAGDAVNLVFEEGVLQEHSILKLSFMSGAVFDVFSNFVQPIDAVELPVSVFTEETEFQMPEPNPIDTTTYASDAPAPVKNWILTRVGSLYSQRTEIALRAGKSNDALFPDKFIHNLLAPYKVRFA